MITFELNKDKTVFNGRKFENLCVAARYVLKRYPDDQPFQCFRGPMLCLRGGSLQAVAKYYIVGNKYVKYA